MAQSEKTEKATPKKRRDERKKGNTYQSRDVVSVVVLLIGFVLVNQLVTFIYIQLKEFYVGQLEMVKTMQTLTIASFSIIMKELVVTIFITALPIVTILMLVAFVMSGVQTKFLISGESIKFKFNKLNPISGIKRIFSLRSIVELIKSILKVVLIIVIIYSTVIDIMTVAPDMLNTALDENIRFLRQNVMSMVYTVTMIFAVIAAADFFYQRYDYEKKLKMTKQEIKDEYKQIEGDPQIKGKIRQKQRQMSQARMMSQVPQADVIVRNPTHFAVAIRYDAQNDPAPQVLAKGQDYLALKIIELGRANNVLIKEDKPLAQMLYKSIEVNDYIPPEMYHIMAELMAWVYNTKKKEHDIS
ncbi:flagellar biosynthesis protein FlhB [Eubacteriaceae bacterium ES2]|nr:flagellar biosynthesis protein FlhB [Eubacteriaceae bacterium ES2]